MNNFKVKFLLCFNISFNWPGFVLSQWKERSVLSAQTETCSIHSLSLLWPSPLLPSLPHPQLQPLKCHLLALLLTEIVQITWERTVNHNYMTSCFWQQVPLVLFLELFWTLFYVILWSKVFNKSLWTFQSLPLYLTHTVLQLPVGLGRSRADNSLLAWLELLYHLTSQRLINFP